jgi:hypothetical protein
MTRHHREKRPKKGGGLLMGMRQGVKKVAGTDHKEKPEEASRTKKILGNALTAVLVIATAGILLQRCGVIHF